jgi:hypothetical protein
MVLEPTSSCTAEDKRQGMTANTPPAILSQAIREFLDELAELISEEILQENRRIQDEPGGTSHQDG